MDSARVTLAAAPPGVGTAATVSPGLWLAGFAVPSKIVGRAFSLIELVRSEADFILAPVILRIARPSGGSAVTAAGLHHAVTVTLGICIVGTVVAMVLYLAGGVRPVVPRLDDWLDGRRTALESPLVLARFRATRA